MPSEAPKSTVLSVMALMPPPLPMAWQLTSMPVMLAYSLNHFV
jgi:hypothetical protein